jgi:hypothetical protein
MPPLWGWLFPVFFLLGAASIAFWLLGLLAEARAHPDRTFFRLSGINPFRGPDGLVDLAPTPRRRYVRAGWLWIWYFGAWTVLAVSTFGVFMIPGVILGGAVAAWILYSIFTARGRLSAGDWRG